MIFNNILFLDIETVSQYETYNHLPDDWKELWDTKAGIINRNREEETSESSYPRASIYAEFGKIICISCGYLQGDGESRKLIIKSYCGHEEKRLLTDFASMLKQWSGQTEKFLCAHNGKEFDYPYICRRMIINGIEIPEILKIAGRKPWEVRHLDTMELWKFGDYKSYTTLNLLAAVFGIPTPKDDIDGSKVWEVYWIEKNLPRIVTYCQKDVLTVAQIMRRFRGEELIREDQVEIA